jgi:adrenodoxin-NADP+ reductase
MHHIAIIGSGPAGYYTAEALQKIWADSVGGDVRVDVIDRMPVPFGLIRSGVAPDHQSIKAVSKRYADVAQGDNVRFVGNVHVGSDVSVDELRGIYDAVVIATGAPSDRTPDIPGADLPGVIGSAAFVGWYNGHPDFADLSPSLGGTHVAIIGNGNVALDVARILAKTPKEFAGSDIVAHAFDALSVSGIRHITILGRRGPHQIAMTPKELGELGHLSNAFPEVDPADFPPVEDDGLLEPGIRKSVTHLRNFAANRIAKRVTIEFDFFAMPVALEGEGRVERMVVERTRLDESYRSVGTGERYTIDCDLVISCIGYQTPPIDSVPYEHGRGRFANVDGRILPGLYCVGWARRGPTGTIGTNRPDGQMIADHIAADVTAGQIGRHSAKGGAKGRPALDALLESRGVDVITFRDWLSIDAAEIANARSGAPREKFVTTDGMIGAVGR